MYRLSISVTAPGHDADQELLSLEVAPSLTVADLKGFINAETNLPVDAQDLLLNRAHLSQDAQTLESAGIKDGDLLVVVVIGPDQPQSARPGRAAQQANPQVQDPRLRSGDVEIENTRRGILGNPQAMAQIRAQRPALADAVNDSNRFRAVWLEMMREEERHEADRLEQLRLLEDDPFNIEAQKKIEEIIRQQSVQENLQFAYEHNPEAFGRVTMLYVPVVVNKHPVKAFVDSGAQTTIMSPSCAEACGIMRLIDKRYSGVARGVGTAQILGRVHSADIKIGNSNISCSFTVMEGKDVDLLLGLDMLKRFQASIDLKQNKLIFGDGNEVAFLGEADIPRTFEEAEPAVPGPNGTEIGTETGTVKPAGTSAAATAAAEAASGSSASSSAFQGAGRALGGSKEPARQTHANTPPPSNTPRPFTASTHDGLPATGPRSGTVHSEDDINMIVGLGFTREQAIDALDATGGNAEWAASRLFR